MSLTSAKFVDLVLLTETENIETEVKFNKSAHLQNNVSLLTSYAQFCRLSAGYQFALCEYRPAY